MANDFDFKLTERDKKRFEAKTKKLTEQDVVKVMTRFGKKLDELEKWIRRAKYVPDFLATFIKNLKLIYELISDSVFIITWTTKSWLIFGLGYFILPFDLIPDPIPIFGYFDDFIVLNWVMGICSDEIERYRSHCRAKKTTKQNNLLLLKLGSSNHRIIIATGFLSKPELADSYEPWINSIRRVDKTASIYSFLWDTQNISQLLSAANILLPNPFIIAGYTIARTRRIWKDAILNTSSYSTRLISNIEDMHKRSKKRLDITIAGHSLGARLIFNALPLADKGLVKNIFTVGGAVGCDSNWQKHIRKINLFINCYSRNDKILSYLYRVAEGGEQPIGLKRIGKTDTRKRIEMDCTSFINGHSEYAQNGEKWFKGV